MFKFAKIALVASLLVSPALALAEDGHTLASIKGDLGIELKAFDHAMAGAVRDFVIWGSVNESTNTSELIMRRDGQDVRSIFAPGEKSFGGVIMHQTSKGMKATSIKFMGLDRQKNEYSFSVNGQKITASVVGEDFKNNHFIKPTYTISGKEMNDISFKFDGQACYKYSLHIITMMIAATMH
ncbi:MAG: hypothetical protein RI953_2335 [Pseudomonadota bacterium]|jgi:hypothetical protein